MVDDLDGETPDSRNLNNGGKGTYLVWLFLHHSLVRCFFETTRVHGVFSVHELLVFPPRNLDIPRVGHHNIVTAIH